MGLAISRRSAKGQLVVNALLERSWIFFGLRLAHLCFHARVTKDAFSQLGHLFCHGYDGVFGLGDALGCLALTAQKPEAQGDA